MVPPPMVVDGTSKRPSSWLFEGQALVLAASLASCVGRPRQPEGHASAAHAHPPAKTDPETRTPAAPPLPMVDTGRGMDLPTLEAWPVTRSWDAQAERAYSDFVAVIGQAVADHRCTSLNRCLNNPAINPLHEAGSRGLRFGADCAD